MNKIQTYIWKESRLTSDRSEKQVECKLIDMGLDELQTAYDHCKHMLYNSDVKNPGRMLILDKISKQINDCGAELALRWFKTLTDADGNNLYSNTSLIMDLRNWIKDLPADKEWRLQDFVSVPPDYKAVTITSLIEAARDNLGYFDHSKISYAFIYRLGIYFTTKELDEIDNLTEGHTLQEKFSVLKSQLGINEDIPLKSSPGGLTEQEFRDMIHMKKYKGFQKCKYSELTTSQLETLRRKVLFAFEEEVLKQIKTWKTLMSQIEEVADYKGYPLS